MPTKQYYLILFSSHCVILDNWIPDYQKATFFPAAEELNNKYVVELTKVGSMSVSRDSWFSSTARRQIKAASLYCRRQRNAKSWKQLLRCSLSDKSHDSFCARVCPSRLHNKQLFNPLFINTFTLGKVENGYGSRTSCSKVELIKE